MSTIAAESFDQQMADEAKRIEAENPRWLVVFGVFTKQFVAYPCFPVPPKTMAVATYPPALIERMRTIEITYGAAGELLPVRIDQDASRRGNRKGIMPCATTHAIAGDGPARPGDSRKPPR